MICIYFTLVLECSITCWRKLLLFKKNYSKLYFVTNSDYHATQMHKTGGLYDRLIAQLDARSGCDSWVIPPRLNKTRTLSNYRPSTYHRPTRIFARFSWRALIGIQDTVGLLFWNAELCLLIKMWLIWLCNDRGLTAFILYICIAYTLWVKKQDTILILITSRIIYLWNTAAVRHVGAVAVFFQETPGDPCSCSIPVVLDSNSP